MHLANCPSPWQHVCLKVVRGRVGSSISWMGPTTVTRYLLTSAKCEHWACWKLPAFPCHIVEFTDTLPLGIPPAFDAHTGHGTEMIPRLYPLSTIFGHIRKTLSKAESWQKDSRSPNVALLGPLGRILQAKVTRTVVRAHETVLCSIADCQARIATSPLWTGFPRGEGRS